MIAPPRAHPLVLVLAAACLLAPHAARAQAPEPPLHIAADNMTGTHGPEGDIVLLKGHVRIVRGMTVITSESGTYQRASGMLYLQGGVTIVDSTTTITCDEASYSEHEDLVHLTGHVRARDPQGTLEAPSATYDRKAGRADLFGGVTGHYKRNQEMRSDRAAYFRDSSVVQARGNVRGEDRENHLTMVAREVDYHRDTDEAEGRGEPALEARGDDGRLTRITARILRLNTETRVAEAIDSVHVERDTLQARGNYGLFDDRSERGWLLGSPRAWDDETTVTGDTLELRTVKRAIDRVVVRHRARLDYRGNRPGTRGETSLLTGERAEVFFTREAIDSLVATGDAKDEYQAVAERGKTPESNVAQGDTIRVYMNNRKIEEARVLGHARGAYQLGVVLADTAAARQERVGYDALAIRFLLPKNRIVLAGQAHVTYRELDLKAKNVEFDSEKQTLVAEGAPQLVDHGDKVVGNLMTYDLQSRVGNIYQAETEYEKGLYHGERIRKVSDNELQVLGGSYSTCDLPDPHYHFSSRRMKIYLKDKLVAEPVVFYVKNVPLLALPFWIFPIKPGRHSGFLFPQFELGFNNKAGRFLRNAGYYWAPNDYFDLMLDGDYYQAEPSWVLRAEGAYKLLYVLDGDFRTSFARNEAAKTEDWDLDADHSQELSPRTRLSARASFVSSRDYNSSDLFGRPISQRLNRFLTSNLAITHAAEWASFNFVIDRRQDLDADQSLRFPGGTSTTPSPVGSVAPLPNLTESLPSLSVSFPTRALGSLPWLKGSPLAQRLQSLYLGLSSRLVSYRERRAVVARYLPFTSVTDSTRDSTAVLAQRLTTRRGFQTDASLTDSRRAFGWISVQPSLSGSAAVFDFDELGHRVVPTGVWSASVATSAALYGTFRTHLGPITGIRHVVSPRLAFTYSPEFKSLFFRDATGQLRSRFNNFAGIGVSGFRREALDFSLDQRLQLKTGSGEKQRKIDNFASLSLGGSYNVLYRDQGAPHALSPLAATLFIQPPGVFNATANAIVDPYAGRPLRSLTYNAGLSLASHQRRASATPDLPIGERTVVTPYEDLESLTNAWDLGLTYSYAGGYTLGSSWAANQTANVVLRMRATPAWNFDYSTSYDVTRHEFGIQQFGITRDLHCWAASFTRTFAPGGEAEYYFRLSVKDQRELYIERGNRTGSLGGIQ